MSQKKKLQLDSIFTGVSRKKLAFNVYDCKAFIQSKRGYVLSWGANLPPQSFHPLTRAVISGRPHDDFVGLY